MWIKFNRWKEFDPMPIQWKAIVAMFSNVKQKRINSKCFKGIMTCSQAVLIDYKKNVLVLKKLRWSGSTAWSMNPSNMLYVTIMLVFLLTTLYWHLINLALFTLTLTLWTGCNITQLMQFVLRKPFAGCFAVQITGQVSAVLLISTCLDEGNLFVAVSTNKLMYRKHWVQISVYCQLKHVRNRINKMQQYNIWKKT